VDINLPGMSGTELLRWIRSQNGTTGQLHIVVVSGTSIREEDVESLGLSLILEKPQSYDGWIDLVYQLQDYLLLA
jgi:CheY-like chemotaxis protein